MHTMEIIISTTDTVIGSIVRKFTHSEWNHISVAIDDNYENIYSFTRKYKKFFFTGCFCLEPIERLPYISIAKINISDNEYKKIIKYINLLKQKTRIYNYPQAILIKFNKKTPFKNSHICSSFGAKMISLTNEFDLEKSELLYTPAEIYEMLKDYIIFTGTPAELFNN